jgi:exonuclease VII small subunit
MAKESFDIEKTLKEIEELKSLIESPEENFDNKMDAYKKAQSKIKDCRDYLSKVELQVEEIKSNSY